MKRKYRRVYHFLKACYALDDLAKQRLKLSQFGKVNDNEEGRAYRLDIPDDVHHMLLAEFAETLCFACFAPNSADPQMWEVYGEHGRGICLGFDFQTSKLRKVEYVSELKVASLPERLFQQWQQERETCTGKTKPTRLDKCMLDLLNPYVFTNKGKMEIRTGASCLLPERRGRKWPLLCQLLEKWNVFAGGNSGASLQCDRSTNRRANPGIHSLANFYSKSMTLQDGEDLLVGRRLREILNAARTKS